MGIKGFSTFLKNKKDENGISCFARSRRISLETIASNSDHRIVIDGSNLRFALYKLVDDGRYGGEYKLYADASFDFFNKLHAKGIMAYVVFDGFVRQQGESRAARSDKAAKTIEKLLQSGGHCNDVLPPCLLREVKYNF
mgnify:CR=1 FL=1